MLKSSSPSQRHLIKSTNSKSLWPRKSNKTAEFAEKEIKLKLKKVKLKKNIKALRLDKFANNV